jgi:Protein of unknown function (DUF2690)
MRISTKARKVLIGAAGITALAAGTMAATTGAANAAAAGPWYGCHGYGCIGKNAVVEHCTSDAATAYAISGYDGVTKARVTLRLRYSLGCDSAWATVTDTKAPDGAVFYIYDRGTHAVEVASTEHATFNAQFQRSAMVGIAGTKAKACIEVRRAHGGTAAICTPFFGH